MSFGSLAILDWGHRAPLQAIGEAPNARWPEYLKPHRLRWVRDSFPFRQVIECRSRIGAAEKSKILKRHAVHTSTSGGSEEVGIVDFALQSLPLWCCLQAVKLPLGSLNLR